MTNIRTTLGIGGFCISLVAPALTQAHHSFGMFDESHKVTLTGAVKALQWTNPHVVIYVDAVTKGAPEPQTWTVELTSPGNLTRSGWTRHSVAPGDKVAVEIAPLRDGRHGGGFEKLTLLDTGKVLGTDFRVLEQPGVK